MIDHDLRDRQAGIGRRHPGAPGLQLREPPARPHLGLSGRPLPARGPQLQQRHLRARQRHVGAGVARRRRRHDTHPARRLPDLDCGAPAGPARVPAAGGASPRRADAASRGPRTAQRGRCRRLGRVTPRSQRADGRRTRRAAAQDGGARRSHARARHAARPLAGDQAAGRRGPQGALPGARRLRRLPDDRAVRAQGSHHAAWASGQLSARGPGQRGGERHRHAHRRHRQRHPGLHADVRAAQAALCAQHAQPGGRLQHLRHHVLCLLHLGRRSRENGAMGRHRLAGAAHHLRPRHDRADACAPALHLAHHPAPAMGTDAALPRHRPVVRLPARLHPGR